MQHGIHKVVGFDKVGPFTLRGAFDDGSSQVIDFQPVLRGELYGPLRDEAMFDQVSLDPEAHTLVWPNGADFDPRSSTTGRSDDRPWRSSPASGSRTRPEGKAALFWAEGDTRRVMEATAFAEALQLR